MQCCNTMLCNFTYMVYGKHHVNQVSCSPCTIRTTSSILKLPSRHHCRSKHLLCFLHVFLLFFVLWDVVLMNALYICKIIFAGLKKQASTAKAIHMFTTLKLYMCTSILDRTTKWLCTHFSNTFFVGFPLKNQAYAKSWTHKNV